MKLAYYFVFNIPCHGSFRDQAYCISLMVVISQTPMAIPPKKQTKKHSDQEKVPQKLSKVEHLNISLIVKLVREQVSQQSLTSLCTFPFLNFPFTFLLLFILQGLFGIFLLGILFPFGSFLFVTLFASLLWDFCSSAKGVHSNNISHNCFVSRTHLLKKKTVSLERDFGFKEMNESSSEILTTTSDSPSPFCTTLYFTRRQTIEQIQGR